MDDNINLSKSELIYKDLKKAIINCEYGLDEIINEKTIANKYNFSKTPVREALSLLVKEGYLVKYPRLGYMVKELKLKEYYQIIQLRFILESGIIRYIINGVKDEKIEYLNEFVKDKNVKYEDYYKENMIFHLEMAKLLENEYIYEALKKVFSLNTRSIANEFYNKVDGDIHINHRNLIQCLKDRDEEGAIKIIRDELYRTDDKLVWF